MIEKIAKAIVDCECECTESQNAQLVQLWIMCT